MRPLNLKFAGFTCYKEQMEIPFQGLDMFAITGPTGAGKSTIVDAICYALYGRVPRQAETLNLINFDKESMTVDLEFEAGGRRYRVHRGINLDKRGKRTVSPVQLEEFSDTEWRPIAGRVQDVDKEIEKAIGLDYKSFTVCVLLPQGRFQEFLAGERKDRRQVLTELLDIGVYEETMRLANVRARDIERDIANTERRLRDDFGDATPEALADVRGQMEEARPRLAQAQAQREALNEALTFAETVMSARRRQVERTEAHSALLVKIGDTEALAKDGRERIAALREQHQGAAALLLAAPYDRERHSALERALDGLHNVSRLKTGLASAKKDADDVKALDAARILVTGAEKRAAEALAAAQQAQALLDEARRLDAAAHVRAGLKPGDPCPVCGGVIGEDLPPVEAGLAVSAEALDDARKADAGAAQDLTRSRTGLAAEESRIEGARKNAERLTGELREAEAELLRRTPAGVKPEEKALEAALRAEADKEARQRELSEREAALRRDIDSLAPLVAGSENTLAQLRGQAGALEAEATQAGEEAEAAKVALSKLAQDWQWLQVADLIKAKQAPNQVLSSQLRGTNTEIESLTHHIASLEADERRIGQGIERAATLRAELDSRRGLFALFKDLGLLLQANYFQAFVMEEAMAALAQAATIHLDYLSQHRFGLTVEKDEFKVIDGWQGGQVRSAATLSGGETFVASLALALALSERVPELRSAASASLDSLFLDEGFGTLDPESLAEVIDALESLRSEERLVGIITHVPELARRIETRIEVSKSQDGSTLRLVGA